MRGNFFGGAFFGGGFFGPLPGGGSKKKKRKKKLRYVGDPVPDILPPQMPVTYPEAVAEQEGDDDVIIQAVVAMKLLH